MKILQINVRYDYGSTGKITARIHRYLMGKGCESVVLYGRIDQTTDKNVYKVCPEIYSKLNNVRSRIDGLMYGGCSMTTGHIISIIKKEKPDIVHLQCINGYFVNIYRLVEWLGKNNIKTVLTLHAEFMYTANCSHAMECNQWMTECHNCPAWKKNTKSLFADRTKKSFRLMKKAFESHGDNLEIVSVSPWLYERAKQSAILKNKKHRVIFNGTDTDVFRVYKSDISEQHNPEGKKVVFHATAMFSDRPGHLKGGAHLISIAEKMKDKPVIFLVAGKTDISGKLPPNIVLLGNITDRKKLAQYYSSADVTLLTSRKETFSMICAESLCCGTPVVGFKAGAPEQIALPEYSRFVEYGDTDALCSVLEQWLEKETDPEKVEKQACRYYSDKTMVNSYFNLYQEMLNEIL